MKFVIEKFNGCWIWTSITLRFFLFHSYWNVKVSSSVCKYNLLIVSLERFYQRNLQNLQQYIFSLQSICNFSNAAYNSSLIRTPLSVFLLMLLFNTFLQLRIFRSYLAKYPVVTCYRSCDSLNKASLSRPPKYLPFLHSSSLIRLLDWLVGITPASTLSPTTVFQSSWSCILLAIGLQPLQAKYEVVEISKNNNNNKILYWYLEA